MDPRLPPPLNALAERIPDCLGADRPRLRRRLAALMRRRRRGRPVDRDCAALAEEIEASLARVAARAASTPEIHFPEALPISAHCDEIQAALQAHQVVIVCGETGSGKTTQLPRLCLAMGRGAKGLIGHTQPRRIAARSVARRIAEELGGEGTKLVGHKIRFQDQTRAETRIKLMTDGILLAEIQSDPRLESYDTLIIDEAHERSLNIDFLLGYLRRLLPRRPDLKVIVTSATIDPASFSRHFGGAPVIEVSGRGHPVEIRYRPPEVHGDGDPQAAILQAVDELAREGPGDILIFLSGERDIRDTAEALRKHHPPGTEILPLYARLCAAEQDRVFRPHRGRRIVLATNVAETSLTVPGIHYVIDTGVARISRYSHRSKVQRLPVEKISRAAAEQRAGRCGRVAPGVCIRLYDEADFHSRPPFTAPEILRTNLASVILRMKLLGLGEVEAFPFMDPPDGRYVRDGYRLLHELQALDEAGGLTPLGRRLAALPLDPRLGRMLLAGERFHCLRELLVIVSALSIQDPRERPAECRVAADEAHRRFEDRRSDFLTWLRLWERVQERQNHLSGNKFRRWCREQFLSWRRLREWRDIHHQLKEQVLGMGLKPNQAPAAYEDLHRAILTGLLGQVAVKTEEGEYLGVRNNRLRLFPTSALTAAPPKWIMAGELLETSRLYALHVARIEPRWIEQLAGHLLRRQHSGPHWHRRRGQVMAHECVTLHGLVVNPRRRVPFAPIDPEGAHEIFLQALADDEVCPDAPFARHNRALLEALEAMQSKLRRRDLADERQPLMDFYRERVPVEISDRRAFERWRRQAEREDPLVLHAERERLLAALGELPDEVLFPDHLRIAGMRLPLEYHFSPGETRDGITLVVPLAALGHLPPQAGEWLVPGLLEEKILALIKGLPKALRRNFVPAADFAAACAEALEAGEKPLLEALGGHLARMTGVEVPADAWRPERLPAHLRMHYRVVDEQGQTLGEGEDLAALQEDLGSEAGASFRRLLETGLERDGITRWDFGELPERLEVERDGLVLEAWPALVDAGESAALRLFDQPDKAAAASRGGVGRLLALRLARPLAETAPAGIERLCLRYAAVGDGRRLRAEVEARIIDHVFLEGRRLPRNADEFEQLLAAGTPGLADEARALWQLMEQILAASQRLRKALQRPMPPAWLPAISDMGSQLDHLVFAGFVSLTPWRWLQHYPRYLTAMERRLERLEADPGRDLARLREIRPLWEGYLRRHPDMERRQQDEDRWLLEELRVSLFAQELKTAVKVSKAALARHA